MKTTLEHLSSKTLKKYFQGLNPFTDWAFFMHACKLYFNQLVWCIRFDAMRNAWSRYIKGNGSFDVYLKRQARLFGGEA